jgi:hypothetical protein
MNMDSISNALLMLVDALRDDEESVAIIELIDTAEGDGEIIEGLKRGVERLETLGKNAIADDIRKKTIGFAF